MAFPLIDGMRTMEFGDPGESRNKILHFLLDGNKRATAGTLQHDYVDENEPIEHVGEHLAVVGNDMEHIATIEITKVEVVRFADVSDEFALAEAEGDLSGDDLRESHYQFWTECGYQIADDTEIVCAYFDLIEDLR